MNVFDPLVSIVIPVYNVWAYIDNCLDSVCSQSWRHLEIIIVDDCSTDQSMTRVMRYLSDPRVRIVYHARNQGLSVARNTGIATATGDYVMFIDSDDVIRSGLVETCVKHAESQRSDVVLFDHVVFDGDGSMLRFPVSSEPIKFRSPELHQYLNLPKFAWLKFIRRSVLMVNELLFYPGLYYEDWPFHCQLWFSANHVHHIEYKGYGYRLRADSITASQGSKMLHIINSQDLMLEVLAGQDLSPAAHRVLGLTIWSGLWYLLINIDKEFLDIALKRSRSHLDSARSQIDLRPSLRSRAIMVLAILKMPRKINYRALQFMRFVVFNLSPARRKAHRKAFVVSEKPRG